MRIRSNLVRLALTVVITATAQNRETVKSHSASELAAKARAIAAKVDGNKPSVVVLGRSSSTVSALIHRARTGEAELHENMADFFVVRSGRGSLVTGGQMKEPRALGSGEFAAIAIQGGERREIGPGDVIYIPARLPHHVIVDHGEPVSYLIIKVKE